MTAAAPVDRRPARGALGGLLALAVLLGARPVVEDPDVARAVAILEGVQGWRDVVDGGAELAALGPAYVRPYLEFLADEASAIGRAVPALEPRRCAVRSALRAQPAAVLRRELRRLAGEAPDAARRVAGMRVLEEVGSVEDVALLADLAAGDSPRDAPLDRELRRTFEEVLGKLLRRGSVDGGRLSVAVAGAHPGLHAAFVAAAGALPPSTGPPLLAAMMGRSTRLDALALVELARDPPRRGAPVEPAVLEAVREPLRWAEPNLTALAATAAAALDDQEAVELLVPLVREVDGGLAVVAAGALQRLTGRRFGPDPDAWERWLAAERAWWSAAAEPAREVLRHGSAEEAARVLGEMAGLRLHRDELAGILALGLRRTETDLVCVTSRVLEDLGSRVVVPDLVETLRSGPRDAQAAAHAALTGLTGRRLPADADAWAAALETPGSR